MEAGVPAVDLLTCRELRNPCVIASHVGILIWLIRVMFLLCDLHLPETVGSIRLDNSPVWVTRTLAFRNLLRITFKLDMSGWIYNTQTTKSVLPFLPLQFYSMNKGAKKADLPRDKKDSNAMDKRRDEECWKKLQRSFKLLVPLPFPIAQLHFFRHLELL